MELLSFLQNVFRYQLVMVGLLLGREDTQCLRNTGILIYMIHINEIVAVLFTLHWHHE